MKFPLRNWKQQIHCPVCRTPLTPAFALINGGALIRRRGIAPEHIEGFFHIGTHDHDQEPNIAFVEIVNASKSQFEFYFCSTVCLRSFFNAAVDALEAKITTPSPEAS